MREGGFFRMKVCVRIAGVSCLRRGTFPTREKYPKARQNLGFGGGVYVAQNTLRGVKCRSPAFVGGARRETQRIPFVQKGRSPFWTNERERPRSGLLRNLCCGCLGIFSDRVDQSWKSGVER